jgi:methionyl-tRNA formyltransferase
VVTATSGAQPLRIVFCGTPEFAVPTLEAVVAAGHDVQLVVTQPDRASGRGLELAAPAVKRAAIALGLPVTQPDKIKNNAEFQAQLAAIAPDVILVVAYGRIIPQWMLDLPKHGNLNLHASLLPKYRGAAPIQWAVANGEQITGNTIMRIDAGLDTGDVLLQSEVPIGPTQTAQDMFGVLAADGAALMVETLRRLNAGMVHARRQDDASATLAPILTREDGRIDFVQSAQTIFNRWRGFQPWPGAYTSFRGKKFIIHAMGVVETVKGLAASEMMVRERALYVGCASGTALRLDEVQVEGKKRIPMGEFLRGYKIETGEKLGL